MNWTPEKFSEWFTLRKYQVPLGWIRQFNTNIKQERNSENTQQKAANIYLLLTTTWTKNTFAVHEERQAKLHCAIYFSTCLLISFCCVFYYYLLRYHHHDHGWTYHHHLSLYFCLQRCSHAFFTCRQAATILIKLKTKHSLAINKRILFLWNFPSQHIIIKPTKRRSISVFRYFQEVFLTGSRLFDASKRKAHKFFWVRNFSFGFCTTTSAFMCTYAFVFFWSFGYHPRPK